MTTHVAFIQERGDFGNALIVALVAREAANGAVELVPQRELGPNVVGQQVYDNRLPNGHRLKVHSLSRLRELGTINVDVTRFHSLNGLKHRGMPLPELEKAHCIVEHFPHCHIRFYFQERKHDSYPKQANGG